MKIRFFALIVGVFLLSLCSFAFADGMPFTAKKPQPILMPLDTPPPAAAPAPEEAPPPAAAAEELPKPELTPPVPESRIVEVQPDTSFFGLSVGMYDPFTHNEKAASFNVEWQPGVKIAGFLQPLFGGIATTNGSLLGYGGIGVPFNLTDRIFMMPSVALGAYKHGAGYDLGRTLAYRVGTELAYQFDDKSRLGLNMHVLTNGTSMNREDRTEIIGLAYTVPLEKISGLVKMPDSISEPTAAPPSSDIENPSEKPLPDALP